MRSGLAKSPALAGLRPTGILAILAIFAVSPLVSAQESVAGPPLPDPPHLDPGGLWAEATLYRDEWGVPHVYAENPAAMAFAFGYAQAADHWRTLLLAYRTAAGRAAEIMGEPYADWDAFAHRMQHRDLALRALDAADPLTAALCGGFAQGVNAWLAEHAARLPAWAEAVHAADVLAFWHAVIMSQAPFDLPGAYHPPRAMESGSAWAVAGSRTETGEAMLVFNPHHHHDGPYRWYEAHLAVGNYDMAGATLIGLPVILQGHNPNLGWALTPNDPDSADMFIQDVSAPQADDPRAGYALTLEYLSRARPYYVRTPQGMEERFVPVHMTDMGPLFEGPDGGIYAWKVGGYGQFGGLRQLFAMGAAHDLDAFRAALGARQIPCFHVTYADRDGNVFYLYNAVTGPKAIPEAGREADPAAPLRDLDWSRPLPHTYAYLAWRSIVPLDDLPTILNPPSGFIQAAGGPPWLATDGAPLDPSAWPEWFVRDRESFRARRIRQLLRSGERSFRDMQGMLYDTHAPAAAALVPAVLEFADGRAGQIARSHPDLDAGLELLRGWNFAAEPGNPAMTFYHVWWHALMARAAAALEHETDLYDAILSGAPEAIEEALGAAAEAARRLRNEYGAIDIPWGEVHRIRRGARDAPLPGAAAGEPIFTASSHLMENGRWYASYGSAIGKAIRFGEEPEAVSYTLFGASGDPDSPHYADQFDLVLERRFKYTLYHREEVLRHASHAAGRRILVMPRGVPGEALLESPAPVHARIESDLEAPAPLPPGLAAFSVFLRPDWRPAEVPLHTWMRIGVPEELCREPDLPALALHAYQEEKGWVRLQPLDDETHPRIFSGGAEGLAVFAVLGPDSLRRGGEEDMPGIEMPPAAPAEEGVPLYVAQPADDGLDAPPGGIEDAPRRAFRFQILERLGRRGADLEEAGPEPETGIAEAAAGDRTFRFERHDRATEISPTETAPPAGAPPLPPEFAGRPIGERQFRIIPHTPGDTPPAPEVTASPDSEAPAPLAPGVPAPRAPDAAPGAVEADPEFGEGPTGERTFRFRRHDEE